MNLKDELEKIAGILVKKAIQNDTSLAESIDAFKELRAYYALTLKEKPDESDGGLSFGGFQRRVQEAEQTNGRSVRSRRESS